MYPEKKSVIQNCENRKVKEYFQNFAADLNTDYLRPWENMILLLGIPQIKDRIFYKVFHQSLKLTLCYQLIVYGKCLYSQSLGQMLRYNVYIPIINLKMFI